MVTIKFEFYSNSWLTHFFILFLAVLVHESFAFGALYQSLHLSLVRMCMELTVVWIAKAIYLRLSWQLTFVKQTGMVMTIVYQVDVYLLMHILLDGFIYQYIWFSDGFHLWWYYVRWSWKISRCRHTILLFHDLAGTLIIIVDFNNLVWFSVRFVLYLSRLLVYLLLLLHQVVRSILLLLIGHHIVCGHASACQWTCLQ